MSQHINYRVFSLPSPDVTTLFQATGTAITSSYALIGAEINCDGATTAFLHVYFTTGTETSIEVQARWAERVGGTQATEVVSISTSAAGQSNLELAEYSWDDGTANILIPIRVAGRFLSAYIKGSGAGITGTYGAAIHLMRE